MGYFGVPLGIADGFLIDGTTYHVPLATEEPSVIAAATYAAKITGTSGGFTAWSDRPVMNGTVYFADRPNLREQISERTGEIERLLNEQFSTMKKRGGGYRGVEITGIGGYVKIRFDVDVCDAMGANAINSAAEKLGGFLSERIGETPILSILTNAATSRRSGAQFTIDPRNIPSNGRYTSAEICRRIDRATEIGRIDPERGVTHNKGIMNGISALALATGNDTRAIEAAAHAWAARNGQYMPLSRFSFDSAKLTGDIELPLPLATIGGAVSFHPAARTSLAILGNPDAQELSRIAAAVGLAQNFAALLALVSGGIQRGHMRLHARRLGDGNSKAQDCE